MALFHQKEGGEFLEETLSILLSPGTPLQLQDLILKTFSRRPTPAVLGTMLAYLKRPPPLKLFHQALECIRPFPSFEVEASLHSLKRDASPPYQELIAQVLKSFYRKQELRYFRILLGERRDKLLWEESWEYFIGHPDPALALHLLPLLVEEEENVREKALELISRIPDPPVEVTEFLSRLIKTLFSRGGESRFLGRILYVFSLSSYPHRVGAAEKFLKNLEEEIGEIFLPFRHSAYLPLRRAFYRPLYEEYYRRGGEEEKTLVIKHIPVPLEEWAKDLLRQALKERTLPLAREAWRRILEERLVGEYLEEALVCPGEMKKELLSVASELASPLPLDLVRSFLLQEGDEVVEKTVLYLRESRTPWPLEFLQTVLFSNLSLQRRRSLFPLIFREGNQERLVEFLKRVVQRRKEGVLRGIEGVWVGGVARLIREGELDDRSLNSLVDPLMLLFEEAEEEPLVVQILLALRELRADEATLEFLLQELKDKQLQELKRRGESSSLGVLLHQTQREIEKKQLLLRSSAQVKERLDRLSHEIPRKKEALGELYRWLLEKPDPLLLKEAKGKVGEALLGEIAKPFQSRERKKMVLELVSLLGLTEAVPLLKTFALTSTPDLKDLLIKTLTQLEEK